MPGRTWTVRLTGHPDHTVSVICSTAACRMPPRSKDAASMRRFAAEHIKAHGRLGGARPNAACSCGSAHCALHESRVQCAGSSLLVLVHNPAVGQVWTLAEVCQTCARDIPHLTSGHGQARGPHPRGSFRGVAGAAHRGTGRVLLAGGRSRTLTGTAPAPSSAPSEPVAGLRPERRHRRTLEAAAAQWPLDEHGLSQRRVTS